MVFSCPDKLNRVISYFSTLIGGLIVSCSAGIKGAFLLKGAFAPQDKEFCSLLIQFLFLFYLYSLPFYLFFKFLFRWQIKHIFRCKNLAAII